MPDVDALIARLEAAGGPDRELDEAIALLLLPELAELTRTEAGGWIHPQYGKIAPAARYTDSLDAAMSLLPEGWPFRVGQHMTENGIEPFAEVNYEGETAAATPAIALLIAILKARKAAA